jgi:hypothetical protein
MSWCLVEEELMRNFRRHLMMAATSAAAMVGMATPAQAALTFQFDFIPGTSVQAQNAFITAGQRWSSLFSDNINVRLTVGQGPLGTGILAQAGSARQSFSYNNVKAALAADVTSTDDATAVANLQSGSSVGMLINRTADNPNGAGSATPYADTVGANNSTIRMTQANAKALGLSFTAGTVANCVVSPCDAFIQFGDAFNWDYNPEDGIDANAYDFTGIATHEIGHSLGFISGVDVLDINSSGPNYFNGDQFTFVSTLDLFRYSADSVAAGNLLDFTADTRGKYFSLDKGVTVGPGFSTGRTFGDGRQASHFKDNLNLGIMDPTAAIGERLGVSANDIRAFDAIGWNLASLGAVPEPSTWAMMISGFGLIGSAMRRRKTNVTVSFA